MSIRLHKYIRLLRVAIIRLRILRKIIIKVNSSSLVLNKIYKSNIITKIAIFNDISAEEPELIQYLLKNMGSYSLFLDGGSNTGIMSCCAYITNPDANIIAVEPSIINYNYILQLIALNKLNIKLYNLALGSAKSVSDFYIPYGRSISEISPIASLKNSFKGTSGTYNNLNFKVQKTRVMSLDDILCEYKKECNDVWLIKLDCEGAELDIIRSTNLINDKNVDFIVEIMINDIDKYKLFDHMINSGFNAYLMTNASFIKVNRPLTIPHPNNKDRTVWRNHFFTKKTEIKMKNLSINTYGKWN